MNTHTLSYYTFSLLFVLSLSSVSRKLHSMCTFTAQEDSRLLQLTTWSVAERDRAPNTFKQYYSLSLSLLPTSVSLSPLSLSLFLVTVLSERPILLVDSLSVPASHSSTNANNYKSFAIFPFSSLSFSQRFSLRLSLSIFASPSLLTTVTA